MPVTAYLALAEDENTQFCAITHRPSSAALYPRRVIDGARPRSLYKFQRGRTVASFAKKHAAELNVDAKPKGSDMTAGAPPGSVPSTRLLRDALRNGSCRTPRCIGATRLHSAAGRFQRWRHHHLLRRGSAPRSHMSAGQSHSNGILQSESLTCLHGMCLGPVGMPRPLIGQRYVSLAGMSVRPLIVSTVPLDNLRDCELTPSGNSLDRPVSWRAAFLPRFAHAGGHSRSRASLL